MKFSGFTKQLARLLRLKQSSTYNENVASGNAKRGRHWNRYSIAQVWRRLIRAAITVLGFSLYIVLQYKLSSLASNLQIFPIIAILAVILYLIIFSKWPLAGFSLWIVISPLVNIFNFARPQSSIELSFDRLALLLPIILLATRFLAHRGKLRRPSVPECLLVIHAIYLKLPVWFSWQGNILALIGYMMAFVGGPICVYYILKSCLQTRRHIISFMAVLMGMGLLWAISGFYEHYTGYRWSSLIINRDVALGFQDIAKGRATGPGQSYPIYGLVLSLAFIIAAHYLGFSRNRAIKAVCFICLPIIAVGLFFGYSKGAYISLAASIILMIFLSRANRTVYISIVVCMAAVVVISYNALMSDALFQARMNIMSSWTAREAMHMTALRMFDSNPVFGVGYGNFSTETPKYVAGLEHFRQVRKFGIAQSYSRPHSEYLAFLAEQGIVGFLLYFGATIWILVMLIKLRKKLFGKDDLMHDCVSILIAFIVCVLLINANDEFYKYPYMYYIIYSIFAVAMRLVEIVNESKLITDNQAHDLSAGEYSDCLCR